METGAISHSKIDVTLTDQPGDKLPGLVGVLTGSLLGQGDEVSNANGRMVFRDLPPGTYQMTFSHEGFANVHRTVTIHEIAEHDPLEIVMLLGQASQDEIRNSR